MKQLPICAECGEPIESYDCYVLDDNWPDETIVCEDCIERFKTRNGNGVIMELFGEWLHERKKETSFYIVEKER